MREDVRQYFETALWSSSDPTAGYPDDLEDRPLDEDYAVADVSAESVEAAEKDLDAFYDKAGDLVEESGLDESDIGHNFWLSRNGHGVGFFDRGLGEIGDKLQDIARGFGEIIPVVTDDGEVEILRDVVTRGASASAKPKKKEAPDYAWMVEEVQHILWPEGAEETEWRHYTVEEIASFVGLPPWYPYSNEGKDYDHETITAIQAILWPPGDVDSGPFSRDALEEIARVVGLPSWHPYA